MLYRDIKINRELLQDISTGEVMENAIKLPPFDIDGSCSKITKLHKNIQNCFTYTFLGYEWIQRDESVKYHTPIILYNRKQHFQPDIHENEDDEDEVQPMYNDLGETLDFTDKLLEVFHHLFCCTDLDIDHEVALNLKKHAKEQFYQFKQKYKYSDFIEDRMNEQEDIIYHKFQSFKKSEKIQARAI